MVFKLIRVDVEEPCKIQLLVGTHIIGRGKFLHNDGLDKRVSRNHAVMEVTLDSVTLKSLHQNPCFYIKKNTKDTEILPQDNTISLGNGDKFGLLPECFWYEVIFCPDIPENNNPVSRLQERITGSDQEEIAMENDRQNTDVTDITQIQNGVINNSEGANKKDLQDKCTDSIEGSSNKKDENEENNHETSNTDEAINFDMSEEAADPNRSASPSLLTTETADKQSTEEYTVNLPASSAEPDPAPSTPSKRNHESDTNEESSPVDVKRVKVEPGAQDAQPGPSNDQSASDSDSKDVKPNLGMPPSPAKPANPLRERCMYGANCYRRNPQHKAQFSHPSDQDWGTGDRGVCPYGTRCRKTDPRHWQNHEHPPGTQPPDPNMPRRPGQQRKRQPKPKRVSISESEEDEDSPENLIVTGKRTRKTIKRDTWDDSGSENEDPYNTDDSDDWQPSSSAPTSQDYTQYD